MTSEGQAIWDLPERTERLRNPRSMFSNSIRMTKIALFAAAALLLLGVLTGGADMPQEVMYADAVLAVAGVAALFVLQLSGRGIALALGMGLVLVFRSIGDPDLMALFEGGTMGALETAILLLLVVTSLVLLLSADGALVLRRSRLTAEAGKRCTPAP